MYHKIITIQRNYCSNFRSLNSNLVSYKHGTFTALASDFVDVDCGFKPTYVTLLYWYSYQTQAPYILEYDNGKMYHTTPNNYRKDVTTSYGNVFAITENGFKFNGTESYRVSKDVVYTALK